MTGSMPTGHHREIVSFVQRPGRMTSGQRRAWERLWCRYGVDVPARVEQPLDVTSWFGRDAALIVEIGSGSGEATARMASGAPDANYLAIDVYQPGLAALLMLIERTALTNLRLVRGDAVRVLRELLPAATVTEIRVFFPDPWPKTRHHKRRLIHPGFVALVASRLVVGGRLHLATDWPAYAEQMRAVCTAEPLLRNAFPTAPGGLAPRPAWRPTSKFEQRAWRENRPTHELVFVRVTGDEAQHTVE